MEDNQIDLAIDDGEAHREIAIAVEQLQRRRVGGFEYLPVVYCGVCDHTKSGGANPFPIYDILVHRRRLKLDFLAKVKYLKRSLICLECDDLPVPVHDGTVGLDRPPGNLIIVF